VSFLLIPLLTQDAGIVRSESLVGAGFAGDSSIRALGSGHYW